jgi:hypothetical protein
MSTTPTPGERFAARVHVGLGSAAILYGALVGYLIGEPWVALSGLLGGIYPLVRGVGVLRSCGPAWDVFDVRTGRTVRTTRTRLGARLASRRRFLDYARPGEGWTP